MKFLLILLLTVAAVTCKDSSGRPECYTYNRNTGVRGKMQCERYNTGFGTYDSCYFIEDTQGNFHGGCGIKEGETNHDSSYCNEEYALKKLDFKRFDRHYCCQKDFCNLPSKSATQDKILNSSMGKHRNSNFVVVFALLFLLFFCLSVE